MDISLGESTEPIENSEDVSNNDASASTTQNSVDEQSSSNETELSQPIDGEENANFAAEDVSFL